MRSKKEIVRLIWVLLVNSFMVYETVPSLTVYRSGHLPSKLWFLQAAISVVALVCGIILEMRKSGFAKCVNIGFYAYYGLLGIFGVLAAELHLWGFTNESWIFFYIVSLPSLLVAAANYFLYRGVKVRVVQEPG